MAAIGCSLGTLYLVLTAVLLVKGRPDFQAKGGKGNDRCSICKDFVESFEKRYEETAQSGYQGGSTAWEEEKLGSYANSEVRLVEIMDSVCDSQECHDFVADNEEDIEHWWFKKRHEGFNDFFQWLCDAHLKMCCPELRYGPHCTWCPGAPNNTCGGQGQCSGSGSRDGSGECLCTEGYTGEMCDVCTPSHYKDGDECKACYVGCTLTCVEGGPQGCTSCADGFIWHNEEGCIDVDECEYLDVHRCSVGTFCVNSVGSFTCEACHTACKAGCFGAGPSGCIRCSNGYEKDESNTTCVDIDECVQEEGVCWEGTYCLNQPGKYRCEACHVSCSEGCTGPGPGGCVECLPGYSKEEEEGCRDVNECESEDHPCDQETEDCQNVQGSFKCTCKAGMERSEESTCVPTLKAKKKKKSKKSTQKQKSSVGTSSPPASLADAEAPAAARETGKNDREFDTDDSDSDDSDTDQELEKLFGDGLSELLHEEL